MKACRVRIRACTSAGSEASTAAAPSSVGTRYSAPRRAGAGSDNRVAFRAEHVHQRDQGQSDEGGGVVAFDAADERDAQPFGLGAARAVVGLLALQIAL